MFHAAMKILYEVFSDALDNIGVATGDNVKWFNLYEMDRRQRN
jgi:hypothetical protein